MTITAIATRSMTQDQVDLVKRTICRDGTDDDLRLFIGVCNATGLNPFMKQIYAVFRNERGRDAKTMTIQTGIDGLRLVAERSGKYQGQLSPMWCGTDGVWREVWLEADPPAACKVGVLRSDFSEPCYGIARWSSYASWEPVWGSNGQKTGATKLGRFWEKMPDAQLAKCAEALALRKAFPNETAGLHSTDEMEQHEDVVHIRATVDAPPATPPATAPTPTPTPAHAQPLVGGAPANGAAAPEPLEAKRARAKAAKAAKTAQNPSPVAAPTATKAPGEGATPPSSPTTPSPGTPSPAVSPLLARIADLKARLGGDQWEELAFVLVDAEGTPDDVRDRAISDATRKAVLGRGFTEKELAEEAAKHGCAESDIATVGQCRKIAAALPAVGK